MRRGSPRLDSTMLDRVAGETNARLGTYQRERRSASRRSGRWTTTTPFALEHNAVPVLEIDRDRPPRSPVELGGMTVDVHVVRAAARHVEDSPPGAVGQTANEDRPHARVPIRLSGARAGCHHPGYPGEVCDSGVLQGIREHWGLASSAAATATRTLTPHREDGPHAPRGRDRRLTRRQAGITPIIEAKRDGSDHHRGRNPANSQRRRVRRRRSATTASARSSRSAGAGSASTNRCRASSAVGVHGAGPPVPHPIPPEPTAQRRVEGDVVIGPGREHLPLHRVESGQGSRRDAEEVEALAQVVRVDPVEGGPDHSETRCRVGPQALPSGGPPGGLSGLEFGGRAAGRATRTSAAVTAAVATGIRVVMSAMAWSAARGRATPPGVERRLRRSWTDCSGALSPQSQPFSSAVRTASARVRAPICRWRGRRWCGRCLRNLHEGKGPHRASGVAGYVAVGAAIATPTAT